MGCFNTAVTALGLQTSLDDLAVIHLRRQLLSFFVHLVHCNLLSPVFQTIRSYVPRMDHALVRSFILQLMHSVAPPYSSRFVWEMLQTLSLPAAVQALQSAPTAAMLAEIRRPLKRHKSSQGISDCDFADVLKQFAVYVRTHLAELGIDPRHTLFLDKYVSCE